MRHDDGEFLRAWRIWARELPGELLDRRIIKAAWRALRQGLDSWR